MFPKSVKILAFWVEEKKKAKKGELFIFLETNDLF